MREVAEVYGTIGNLLDREITDAEPHLARFVGFHCSFEEANDRTATQERVLVAVFCKERRQLFEEGFVVQPNLSCVADGALLHVRSFRL